MTRAEIEALEASYTDICMRRIRLVPHQFKNPHRALVYTDCTAPAEEWIDPDLGDEADGVCEHKSYLP